VIYTHETECGLPCKRCGLPCYYMIAACNDNHWCGCDTPLWHVYIVRCADDTLYTGITNNIDKRIVKHNKGTGAKYTKARRPVILVKSIECVNKSEALKLEYKIKQMPKKEKLKPQINFCDKCHKVVPEEQITYYEPNSFCKEARYVHQYKKYVNLNGPSGGMNFCGGYETQYCGNIREPSQEEYFIYVTCK